MRLSHFAREKTLNDRFPVRRQVLEGDDGRKAAEIYHAVFIEEQAFNNFAMDFDGQVCDSGHARSGCELEVASLQDCE